MRNVSGREQLLVAARSVGRRRHQFRTGCRSASSANPSAGRLSSRGRTAAQPVFRRCRNWRAATCRIAGPRPSPAAKMPLRQRVSGPGADRRRSRLRPPNAPAQERVSLRPTVDFPRVRADQNPGSFPGAPNGTNRKPVPVELDWLETFLAVVDRGGFTAASAHVHRSQSRVSAHIARARAGAGRAVDRPFAPARLRDPGRATVREPCPADPGRGRLGALRDQRTECRRW